MLCDNLECGREVQEGGDICILMNDLCWCMAETSTIIPQTKIKKKKRKKEKELRRYLSLEHDLDDAIILFV